MEDDGEAGLVLELEVLLELMPDAEGGGLAEDLALGVELRVGDGVGAGDGDLVAVEDLHNDPLSVVVLVLLVGGSGHGQADGDRQFFLRLEGPFHNLGAEDPFLVEHKFEESIAVATVVEVDVLLGEHLQGSWLELKLQVCLVDVNLDRDTFGGQLHLELVDAVDEVLYGCLKVPESVLAECQLKPGLSSAGDHLAILV